MQCATHITINHDKESIVSITKLTRFVRKLKALRSLYVNEGVVLKDNISHFLRTITRTAIVYLQVSAVEHDIFQNESRIFSNYDISIFCIKSNDDGFNPDSMNNDKDTTSPFYISDSNDLELTPKGSHSLDQVLKRHVIDMYDTPERTYNAIKRMKLLHKAEDINQGVARVRNHEINTLVRLPRALDAYIEKGMRYRQLKRVKEDDILLATSHNNDDRVDEVVLAQAAQLMEAVVVGKMSWFVLTQFDIFFQGNPGYDDCARKQEHAYTMKPYPRVISKEEFGNTHYQLVIRWGNIEVLALGGYYGKMATKEKYGFLGSSVPKKLVSWLSEDLEDASIFIPLNQQDYIQNIRFLRDYTKEHASRMWSLESRRTAVVGRFRACHPLSFGNHWTMQNIKYKTVGHLASLVFKVLCKKQYTRQHQQAALTCLSKTKDLQECMKDATILPTTLSEVQDIFNQKLPKSPLLQPLNILVQVDKYLQDDQLNINIITIVPQLTTASLDLYKSVLAKLITKANDETLESVTI
ncbi:hypothetical protein INT45_001515 [Circinella minor]|uniref:Uncharacterized protein n=1 Tax=Circinella minor TaxID=1195481 RepID=A0A8H7VJM3_9FUNG|nr:hypothetical protein INT45_001515 [Circinella minor]